MRYLPDDSPLSLESTKHGLALKVDGKIIPYVMSLQVVHEGREQYIDIRIPMRCVRTDATIQGPSSITKDYSVEPRVVVREVVRVGEDAA